MLQASGAFSLYLDSQDGDGLEVTHGGCQFSYRGEYKAQKKFFGHPHKIAILDLDAPMIFTPGHRDLDLDASNLFKKNYYLQDLRYPVPRRSKKEGAVGRTIYDFNELLF